MVPLSDLGPVTLTGTFARPVPLRSRISIERLPSSPKEPTRGATRLATETRFAPFSALPLGFAQMTVELMRM